MNQKEEFFKKVRYLLFAIFLCAPLTAMAQGDIKINKENFPDENFRNYLQEQSYGQDGIITEEEIEGIIYINVSEKNIRSLKGIEYFTALRSLYCSRNQLTSLDVSQNAALTELYCHSNQLTSLDVSQNTALTYLDCSSNQLTSLDVSQNTALRSLYCRGNQLTSLDVLQNITLTELFCDGNQLTSLDVSQNAALTYLDCHSNQLTSLDVSQNTALTTLYCHSNQLTSLDVSQNTALTSLYCSRNQLTSLDVSQNTALTYLGCESNQLISLDISQNTALTTLYCGNNQLTSLDVSNCTALTLVVCQDNQLTALDVSQNTALTSLGCHSNQLTSLDVSQNTALTSLGCGNNQLTSLDVSQNTALTSLSCYINSLTSLDVSQNTALTDLQCYHNQIKGEAMDLLISSLPENVSGAPYTLYLYYSTNEGNVCTKAQVVAAKAKGWTPYYNNSGWKEYEGSDDEPEVEQPEGIAIDEAHFPDENFRNYLQEQSYGQDGIITEEEIKGIIYINVSEKNISSLKGIEYFTALTTLYCHINQLTSLDVSQNTALTSLNCGYNQLTSLDVSQNTALTQLVCGSNQLTSLDVSQNTALTSLNCYSNQLTSLDVSQNTALTSLNCESNQLTSLDVSQNTALTQLVCGGNQLTSLDVSQNTALTSLYCGGGGNQLTSLDVSKNTALTTLECYGNQLTSLDVSQNTALTSLGCEFTQLISLDISQNTALTSLNCANNQLTSLDVSQNTALTSLWCPSNQLTSLDVSKNTALTSLYCWGNQLTSLDVSKNTALTELRCYRNQIKGEAMDLLISSLPENVSGAPYTLYLYYSTNEGNVCTKAQVAAAKAKGWTPYYNNSDWKEYEGSDDEPEAEQPEGIAIDETNFPDENFRNWLLEQDYGQDGIITEEEIKDITRIFLYQKGNIRSLKGIEHFVALTYLDCSYNQLTELDVSQNTALTSLGCNGNQLTSLDISANTALIGLGCGQNLLTSLDISKNTALTTLQCAMNQLTELDISKNTALRTLDCFENQLTSLDVSKHTALTLLQCGDNPLKSLDISNNTELTGLYCNSNELAALDISKNTKLTWVICSFNQLSALDVSNNTALTSLDCSSNQIKGAAMDVLIGSLPQNTTGELYKFIVLHEYNEGNVCTKRQVAAAKAKGWTPYYNNSGWKEYEGSDDEPEVEQPEGIAIDETNFPDENFRAYLLEQDYGKDGLLTEEEIKGVTSIDVSGQGISSLKGIELFTALTTLDCSMNQLAEEAVTELLSSLPKAENGTLRLYDDANDGEGNVKVLADAQVALAQENGWTLYYYNGTEWVEYGVNNDDDNGDDDGDDNGDDDDNTGGDGNDDDNNDDDDTGDDNDDDDNNTGDDNGADDDDTGDDDEDPETPDVVIDEETFPDEAFRDILSELVGGEAGNVLTEEEIKEITSLDISESGVSDLTGLEYLTALTELVCEGNKLESLDVSKNTELTMIDCSRNQIKGEGMDAFISSLPQKTAATRATTAAATEVYVLRVYDSTAEDEGNVCTKEQVEAINAKGWTPYYYNGKEWLEYTGYDDEATGISWLGTGDGSVSVYNMAGQKVNLPANAKKGVYIVNGKKVVVK